MKAWPRPSARYIPRRSTSSRSTPSHRPNVGEPTRRSTTTSKIGAGDARDVLGLAGRHVRVVDAADDPRGRHRAVGLGEIEVVADCLAEAVGPEPLEEHAAVVAMQLRRDLEGAVDGEGADLHGAPSWRVGRSCLPRGTRRRSERFPARTARCAILECCEHPPVPHTQGVAVSNPPPPPPPSAPGPPPEPFPPSAAAYDPAPRRAGGPTDRDRCGRPARRTSRSSPPRPSGRRS